MPVFRTLLCSLALFLLAPLALAQGTYTQIDYPGAYYTKCFGINTNGDVAGYALTDTVFGFVLSNGVFTTIEYPGASSTTAGGINDVGQVVGNVSFTRSGFGFVYDTTNQTFTTVTFHGVTPGLSAINNSGTIVGLVEQSAGFEEFSSGKGRIINVPGSIGTNAYGISAHGAIVGDYFTGQKHQHQINFLFKAGAYHRLQIPNATGSIVYAINPAGTAFAGSYRTTGTGSAGFVYQNNTLTTLQFPGGGDTFAFGINSSGQVTGIFFDSDSNQHCFIWTPDAPAGKP
jgi:uncharacterized membrane protein